MRAVLAELVALQLEVEDGAVLGGDALAGGLAHGVMEGVCGAVVACRTRMRPRRHVPILSSGALKSSVWKNSSTTLFLSTASISNSKLPVSSLLSLHQS